MKTYQLILLISPDSSTQEVKSLQEKIKSSLQEKKGSLTKMSSPSKKRLAYSIKEKREAFLSELTFSLEPKELPHFDQDLKREKQILRYLIEIKKVIKEPKERKAKPRKETKAPKAKVELKEIEKKLEEILGS